MSAIIEINSEQIKWPVLCVKDEKCFVFNSSKDIIHTSRELLASGVFNDVTLIDCNGSRYEITSATELKSVNLFGGLSLLKKGRQVIAKIELKLVDKVEPTYLLSLASAKSKNDQLIQEKITSMSDNPGYKDVICLFE